MTVNFNGNDPLPQLGNPLQSFSKTNVDSLFTAKILNQNSKRSLENFSNQFNKAIAIDFINEEALDAHIFNVPLGTSLKNYLT